MALIQCPECGRGGVSDQAAACPRCGFPLREKAKCPQCGAEQQGVVTRPRRYWTCTKCKHGFYA